MITYRVINRFVPHRRLSRLPCWNAWLLGTVCLVSATLYIIYYYYNNDEEFLFGEWRQGNQVTIDLSKNYFKSTSELSRLKYLVDNDKCRIPNVDVWDPGVLPFTKIVAPSECSENVNLTYVKDQSVIINEDAVTEMGYQSIEDISCCYRIISRVTLSAKAFDTNADNRFKYSKLCYPMSKVTQPVAGFIGVVCKSNSLFWKRIIYTNFHIVAQFPIDQSDNNKISKKVEYWKRCASGKSKNGEGPYCRRGKKNELPPNILILGIDSTSRLNFHRQMPRSSKMLRERLGAIEMKGYTKVGENTFPNFVAMMTSYSRQELRDICYFDPWIPQDKCPYIWKSFSKQNYLTAHLEDAPYIAIFNYMKTGFIYPPADIYLRPWMLAVHKEHDEEWNLDCIGYQRPEHIILDYVVDLATLSHSKGIPYFITTWLSDLTHDDMNSVQRMDTVLENTLRRFQERGLLENTVLYVMSDHGYRYADIRATNPGWYEDKLPAMFIRLPEKLARKNSSWVQGLKYNSKQLTTPFDIHVTLKEILDSVTTTALATKVTSAPTWLLSQVNPTAKTNPKLTSPPNPLRGLSLFKKLPLRSCEEAGISTEFCPCHSPVAFTSNMTLVRLAADALIHKINQDLPSVCQPLEISSITAAATLQKSATVTEFIISLVTRPGDFRFEGWVTFDEASGRFTDVSSFLRTSKKEILTPCLDGSTIAFELQCFCKREQSWSSFIMHF